nr:hypothetical protein REQ54_00060 [Rhizobium sp. Q54]
MARDGAAHTRPVAFNGTEDHAALLESPDKLGGRRTMKPVPVAFKVPDRAAGHQRTGRQFLLRPIKESACGTA